MMTIRARAALGEAARRSRENGTTFTQELSHVVVIEPKEKR